MNFNEIGNINATSTNFKWVINNFNYGGRKPKESLLSPIFLTTCNGTENKWQLLLYPKGDRDNQDYLSIYLRNVGRINVTATVQFSILNNKQETVAKIKCTPQTFGVTINPAWGLCQFVYKNKIATEILNDTLTILVEIFFEKTKFSLKQKVDERKTPENLDRLSDFDDFEKLLSDEKFSDVKFKVDGKELRAHKNILAARSDVFRAMFEHNVKENIENEVDIVDIKYEVFKELLRYIYAGKVNDINRIMDDLLVAAEKYSLDRLKAVCEKTIYKSLTADNVIRYLSLANVHNATILKSQAIEFIVSNADDIIDKQEFKLLEELAPDLICTVFRAIVKKDKESVSK